jgi:predicted transposase/invertase (TIGR01784 family)
MRFADLKNDFVFRRVFGNRPRILKRLLNDVLVREGEQTIEEIEYLPGEQVPLFDGAKLSILDVRCKERSGTTFVVEMQLIHHPGFLKRVVYNACKAYASQLKQGEWYTKLSDVVAVSICDFELWPDAEQDKQGLPHVPMLSRWSVTERASRTSDLLQVQYAFLELPKLPQKRPEKPGVDLWAWLFVHATELTEIPPEIADEPYGEALELANEAQFTAAELDAYRRSFDEIHQVIEIANDRFVKGFRDGEVKGFRDGESKGFRDGLRDGEVKARRETLLRLFSRAGLEPSDKERAHIDACTDVATLDRWLDRLFGAKTVAEVVSS